VTVACNSGKRPVTEETAEEVRALHAQGLGRNEIARRLQRSPRTVSVLCAEMGLSFDRTMTEEATRARVADVTERRAILAEALQTDAERLTERMWLPAVVYNFGGKDNSYEEREVDEPPAGDKRALMSAAGMAIDRSLRLLPPAAEAGAEAARSMVGQLMSGIAAMYHEQQDEDAGGETADEGAGDAP
jgi:hypothetical protein